MLRWPRIDSPGACNTEGFIVGICVGGRCGSTNARPVGCLAVGRWCTRGGCGLATVVVWFRFATGLALPPLLPVFVVWWAPASSRPAWLFCICASCLRDGLPGGYTHLFLCVLLAVQFPQVGLAPSHPLRCLMQRSQRSFDDVEVEVALCDGPSDGGNGDLPS